MVMFDGQAIVGGCVSFTVTVKEQDEVLPAASVTEQFTVVAPLAKVEPGGGTQFTEPRPGQLSAATGREYETSAVH